MTHCISYPYKTIPDSIKGSKIICEVGSAHDRATFLISTQKPLSYTCPTRRDKRPLKTQIASGRSKLLQRKTEKEKRMILSKY
jgi:hypothetical protein